MLEISEGVSRYSVEIVLSHSTETFRSGNLLGCVSENFRWRKTLWITGRGREEVSKFSIEYFLSQGAENFLKEPFSVSLISVIEKR